VELQNAVTRLLDAART